MVGALLILVAAFAIFLASDIAATTAQFVAVVRNPSNAFAVPVMLAPPDVGATPQAAGAIRLRWTEPGTGGSVTPAATSWAGAYLVYRNTSPATPAGNSTPYATVTSDGSGGAFFLDGTSSVAAGGSCTSSPCTIDNTRYWYWIRALSRHTGFPSPLLSLGPSAAADRSPPQVLSVSPATGATGVPLSSNVQVTFTEPVDYLSALSATCITLASSPSACVPVTGNLTRWTRSSGVLLEVRPTDRLQSNGAYQVGFTSGVASAVRDLAGNVMSGAATATFTTEVPASTVAIRWRSPALDAQEYLPSSGPVVGIAFAEPMSQAVASAAFQLFAGPGCQGASLPVASAWNATGNAVAFTPASPLHVGLMASPTFGVHTYSMRFNEVPAQGLSTAGNGAASIACSNGTFVPSAPVLAFDLADVAPGLASPSVVAGETITLRGTSGPWRQGSFTTLVARFDEPAGGGAVESRVGIGGDSWSGLSLPIPAESPPGLHFVAVQNEAVETGVGQDARTAFRAITIVEPSITVATYDLADTLELAPRTALSPLPGGDTVRVVARVTAPRRDGTGTRPVAGIQVKVRAIRNPVSYLAVLCDSLANGACGGSSVEIIGTTDEQGYLRGYLTAPAMGAPFNSIVVLASAGNEWGSVVLTDPAPVPPSGLVRSRSTTFSWSPSPSAGVAGYRLVFSAPAGSGASDVVVDAGLASSIPVPPGGLVPGVEYRVTVIAYDQSGRPSERSEPITFVAPPWTPTSTPTQTRTSTPTRTPTSTPTRTPTSTPTQSPTLSPTIERSATPPATGTFTWTATAPVSIPPLPPGEGQGAPTRITTATATATALASGTPSLNPSPAAAGVGSSTPTASVPASFTPLPPGEGQGVRAPTASFTPLPPGEGQGAPTRITTAPTAVPATPTPPPAGNRSPTPVG